MRIGVHTLQLHRKITGSGRFTQNLLRALAQMDHDNEYVLFLRKDNAPYFSVKQENFTNHVCNITKKFKLWRIAYEHLRLPMLARKHHVDVFWSPSDIAPWHLPCISTVTIHDLKRFIIPQEFPLLEMKYFRMFLRNTAKRANLIFTGSESSGRDIMKYLHIPPERIIVAHYGLDPAFLEEKGVSLDCLKRIHGIKRKYILFVGQLIKSKNVPRMIRVFNQCKAAADYDFVIIGQPSFGFNEVDQTIKRESSSGNLRDRIHLVKWASTEHLVAFYKNASALLYASLYEGFGFPILEAMACGLPVITSTTSSMPEVAGDASLLVDPTDEKAMTAALERILTDDQTRQILIRKGYERVTLFSWENTAKKYLAVFNRLKQSL